MNTTVPTLKVYRIWNDFVPDKADPAKLVPITKVAYGSAFKTDQTVAQIRHLNCLRPDAPEDDIAAQLAKHRWEIIKPHYDAFMAGEELPLSGTPIAAWNAITPEKAEVLKAKGVRTVEDISMLTDTHLQTFNIPGLRALIEGAKLFLKSADTTRAAAEMKQRDVEIAGLKDQNAELLEKVNQLAEMVAAQPKRGPGRPKNDKAEEAA